MDRDAAIIALVDSNLHREHLLPSEKAFAYKMKMEAVSHQGQRSDLTSSQVATKLDSASSIGKSQGESRDQVFRYIRLTYLIPEILQMVDEQKIALTPAVELSYLTESQQRDLLETMESEDCTPSLSQSQQLKKLSQSGVLSMDRILELLQQPKANQEEKLRFDLKDIRHYFPKNYTTERIQKTILQLLEKFERNWKRRSLKCYFSLSVKFLVSVYKTRCLPEGADLGFGGFPNKQKSGWVAPRHCSPLLYDKDNTSRRQADSLPFRTPLPASAQSWENRSSNASYTRR